MKELWQKFENWLQAHYPEGLQDLNLPATDEEIADLEAVLGAKLPADVVESLKIHNGQGGVAGGLTEVGELLSVDSIADQWSIWKELLDKDEFDDATSEPDEGVKNHWWNPKWIPFTHDGGGNHLCLDLDPAEGGESGQIITMWHDSGEREMLAGNFADWFEDYVNAVLAGEYVYSDDYDGLVHVDDA